MAIEYNIVKSKMLDYLKNYKELNVLILEMTNGLESDI